MKLINLPLSAEDDDVPALFLSVFPAMSVNLNLNKFANAFAKEFFKQEWIIMFENRRRTIKKITWLYVNLCVALILKLTLAL